MTTLMQEIDGLKLAVDRLIAENKELRAALALPSMWESAMDEQGCDAADDLLKRYGWDFKCSPGDFMEQYARAILAKTGAA